MRLIDADALQAELDDYIDDSTLEITDVKELIDNAPTVDITEEQAIDKLHKTGWLPMHDNEMTEREK